jgi:hypothetical protein
MNKQILKNVLLALLSIFSVRSVPTVLLFLHIGKDRVENTVSSGYVS